MNSGYPASLRALVLAMTLSACVPPFVRDTGAAAAQCPPGAGIALTAAQLMQYHACIGSLPAPDLETQYGEVALALAKNGRDSDRVKLAMLLAAPGTSFHDTEMALSLLTAGDSDAAPPDLRHLTHLLSALLLEQQRAEDAVSDLSKSLAAERARSAYLQKKIDAVKDLEINLNEKYQP